LSSSRRRRRRYYNGGWEFPEKGGVKGKTHTHTLSITQDIQRWETGEKIEQRFKEEKLGK
jgi:hypothetical protein